MSALTLWCALTVRASPDPRLSPRVALRLEADPDCVSIERLRSRIAATRWRLSDDAAPSAPFALVASVLRQLDGGLLVTLQVRWRDGRSAARTVAAQSCEASLEALALLVQMTLDAERPRAPGSASSSNKPAADARGNAAPSRSPSNGRAADAAGGVAPSVSPSNGRAADAAGGAAPSVSPSNGREADAAGRAAPSGGSAASAGHAPVSVARGASVERGGSAGEDGQRATLDAERGSWHSVTGLTAGMSLGLGTGAAPQLQPGVGVFAGLGVRGTGIIKPWFQIELAHAWASGISRAAGRADFMLDGGQLLLCPCAWKNSFFAAHGCAMIELARLRARGYDTYEPRTHVRAWVSAGAGLWLRAPLWKLELQLGAALLQPLWRDQFSFAPEVFYAVPAWRWQLKLGLGARFL